jgi:hypothetical protein
MGAGGGIHLRGRALLSLRLLGLQAAQGLAGLLFVAVQGLHHLFAALGGCRVGGRPSRIARPRRPVACSLSQRLLRAALSSTSASFLRPRGLLDALDAVAQLARLGQQGPGA